MKRFFKSIGREGSFKRLATSRGEDGTPVCAAEDTVKREPTKFLSWNTNSFLLRLKTNREEVFSLLRRLDPDVIAIQVLISSARRMYLNYEINNKITSSLIFPWLCTRKIELGGNLQWFNNMTCVPHVAGNRKFAFHQPVGKVNLRIVASSRTILILHVKISRFVLNFSPGWSH